MNSRTTISIYVNYILFTGPNIITISDFKKEIERILYITDLGRLRFYLDIKIIYNR